MSSIKKPKLSVVIPVYNVAQYLSDALNSILDQSLEELEVIVINDGSTDDSPQIINEYSSRDDRIVVINKINEGYGRAVNSGIEISTGDYVHIFEPDDIIYRGMYAQMYEAARKTDADIIKSNGFYRFQGLEIFPNPLYGSGQFDVFGDQKKNYGQLWLRHPSIWNALYKKKFLFENDIRMPDGAGASFQDVQWTLCLYAAAKTIYLSSGMYYYYRVHDSQSINNADGNLINIIHNWWWYINWIQNKSFRTKEVIDFSLLILVRQVRTLCEKRLKGTDNIKMLLEAAAELIYAIGGSYSLACKYASEQDRKNYNKILKREPDSLGERLRIFKF